MKKIKVLFLTRRTAEKIAGGDVIQLQKTARGLIDLGYDVTIGSDLSLIDSFKPDILHFSGINLQINMEETLSFVRSRANKIIVVMSSVYVSYENYEKTVRKSLIVNMLLKSLGYLKLEYLKEAVRLRSFGFKVCYNLMFRKSTFIYDKYLCDIDCFLPNSVGESEALVRNFNIPSEKIRVITNGAEFNTPSSEAEIPYSNFVLCVARIERLKNQVSLVKACKKADMNLILVGALSPSQKEYYDELFELLDDKRIYIGALPHDELVQYYKSCSVHALVSHFETCGLSTMEAIHFDKNVVASDVGYVKSVFSDGPFYCDPNDVPSIVLALQSACANKVNIEYCNDFKLLAKWSVASNDTHQVYKELLKHDG